MRHVIGIDLGGTSIKYAIVNENGRLLYEAIMPSLANESSDQIIKQILAAIDELVEFAETEKIKLSGLGIGSPGIIDRLSGTVLGGAENLKGWENIALSKIIRTHIDMPVYVDNDANVMGLAEATFGSAKGSTDVVFLTIGTGIGGALVINGKLYGGYSNRGAELGHFPLIADGEDCACGSVGCFEHYASATALIRNYTNLCKENGKEVPAELDGKVIVDLYHKGDENAIAVVNENCKYIGHAVAGFINIFSPQKVIIGGGLADAGQFYLELIKKSVNRYVMPDCAIHTSIELASLGNQAGCLGAAGLVFTA